ncbi:MAG: hypothetical protein VCD00_13955, partial [Candidatus Hydrogenedentota bacterium]
EATLIAGDRYSELMPYDSESILRIWHRGKIPATFTSSFPPNFHPMDYFRSKFHIGFPDILREAFEIRRGNSTKSVSVRQEDIRFYVYTDDGVNTMDMEFSLWRGGNLSHIEWLNGRYGEQCDISYQEVDGVWIPLRYEWHRIIIDDAGNKTTGLGEQFEFIVNKINATLSENEFTYERIGVAEGTEVRDYIKNTNYKYISPVLSSARVEEKPSDRP